MLHHQENALIGALSHSRILVTALIRLLKKAQQQGIWLAQKSVKSRGVKFNKFLRAAQIELSAIILFYVSLCTHWSFGFQNFASFLRYETCLVDLYKKEVFINIDCTREVTWEIDDRGEAEVDIDFRGLHVTISHVTLSSCQLLSYFD